MRLRGKSSLGAVALIWVCSGSGALADTKNVDHLVQQWLSVEQQKNTLEAAWNQDKPILDQRQTLLQSEIKQLQSLLSQNTQSQDDVSQKREQLLAEQTALEDRQTQTQQDLTQLNALIQSLQPQLPPPLASRWREEASQLTPDAEPNQRLQVAISQLSQLLEFNQRISVHEMPLAQRSGEGVLVPQLYLGAGFAWFVSPDGKVAGTGSVTDGQWQWQFRDDISGRDIQNAIATFHKTRDPALLMLPVTLTKGGAL